MAGMNEWIAGWMAHRKVLLELLNAFEDKHMSYKPWNDAMSVAELSMHIIGSTSAFTKIVKGEPAEKSEAKPKHTADELKAVAQSLTERTRADLASLTPEQLERTVEFAGMKMPGLALLEAGKEHEIHHKGQLFVYARLLGIDPLPFFISRG